MLPAEILTDAIAFVKYYDLGPLLVANKQLSDLARKASNNTRISDLSGFDFAVGDNSYYIVYAREVDDDENDIHTEVYEDEAAMAAFISEAFRRCVVGNLEVELCYGRVLHALKEAANTVIVTDTLSIKVEASMSNDVIVDFVDAFQRVKKLRVLSKDTDVSAMQELCQRKNIEWEEAE